jgi:hypothetical protein
MIVVGKKSVPGTVAVGVTVKRIELEPVLKAALPGVETGDAGGVEVAIVPFPSDVGPVADAESVTVGEAEPVIRVEPDRGVVMTVVGEPGRSVEIAVELTDTGGGDTGDTGGVVGTDVPIVTVPEAGGGVVITTGPVVVAAALVIIEPMTLVSEAMILERRLPSPMLLVVAAAPEDTGVETITPVEAAPLTPVEVAAAVGVGRMRFVKDDRRDGRGSGITTLDAAAEETGVETVGAADGVVTGSAVGVGVGVGVVGGSRTLERTLLRIGTNPGSVVALVAAAVEAAAVAIEAPVPENVTPEVTLSGVEIGVEELDGDPVKTPPGPNVIPVPAAEDEDNGVSIVVAAALLGEVVGKTITDGTSPLEAVELAAALAAAVGKTMIDGTSPLEAAELAAVVGGSTRLSRVSGVVEAAAETAATELEGVASAPTVVV